MLIGVYGTLKKRFHQNIKLKNAKFIKEAFIPINYKMYTTGAYPCLVKDNDVHNVLFEIYEIPEEHIKSTIAALDSYEGYPYLFKKDSVMFENNEVNFYIAGEGLTKVANEGELDLVKNNNF